MLRSIEVLLLLIVHSLSIQGGLLLNLGRESFLIVNSNIRLEGLLLSILEGLLDSWNYECRLGRLHWQRCYS
jgi:hypothetical protein